MKTIGPTTIAKLIEAHIDNDDEKFFSYANFIADAYEEQGKDNAAKIIRNRISGEYKTAPRVVLDSEDPCEDTISREAVLSLWDLRLSDKEIYMAIRNMEPVTPSEYKEHWIYVKDRLPTKEEYIESNGLFIVSDGNRSYAKYFDIYDKQMFGEPTMEGFRVDKCVSKWMPLPKPCGAEMESKG